jgi:CheY-like chemotaxis protein
VELPLIAGSSRRDDAPHKRAREDVLAGLSILVVEDEADSSELLVTVLSGLGAQCTAFSRAADALRCLEARGFDLLISDVGLPELDGYALIRAIRGLPGRTSSIPAIALTAYGSEGDRERARQAGFDHHQTKPLDVAALVTLLRTVTGRSSGPGAPPA